MKKKQSLENKDKSTFDNLTLGKSKIAKLNNLISIKGGAFISNDPPETDNDTWGG